MGVRKSVKKEIQEKLFSPAESQSISIPKPDESRNSSKIMKEYEENAEHK